MAVNKVDYSGETLIDLTEDTVTPDVLLSGETAHSASGEVITGKAVLPACGTCDTAGNVAEKVVTLEGNDNWVLKKGAIIMVKFANTNSATNVTLNVNGTGAKQIWYAGSVYTGNSGYVNGEAGRHHVYLYDGTYWVWVSHGYDVNTTYTNQSLGQGYATCTTAAATTAKVATLSGYGKTLYGIVAVKFTYAVPANATLNINNRGANAIYYRGSAITAGVIKAGNTATFMYDGSYYQLLTIDKLTASDVGAVSTGGGTFTGQITGENGNGDETWWIDEYGDAGGFNSLNATTLKESGTSLANKYATKSHTHTTSDITDISSLQSKTWNKIGEVTGTEFVVIPSIYNEVYAEIWCDNLAYTFNTFFITSITGGRNLRFSGISCNLTLEISPTYIKIIHADKDGVDVTSSSKMFVYAR